MGVADDSGLDLIYVAGFIGVHCLQNLHDVGFGDAIELEGREGGSRRCWSLLRVAVVVVAIAAWDGVCCAGSDGDVVVIEGVGNICGVCVGCVVVGDCSG